MSLLNFELDKVPELESVPGGEEYEMQVVSVAERTDKNGDPGLLINFTLIGKANTKPVTYWQGLPGQSDDEDSKNRKLRRLRTLCQSLDYEYGKGVDTEQLRGMKCWAILEEEETEQYGKSNRIRKFVVPEAA